MNRFLKGVLVLIILGVLVLIVLYPKIGLPWQSEPIPENAQAGSQATQVLEVNGIVVQPSELRNTLSITGEVIANEFVEIKSELSGILQEIRFDEGQRVRKGDLLARINVDELLAEREKLKYTQQLRETLEHRQRQLLEREAISQEEYDQALNELQTVGADIELINVQIEKSYIRAPFSGIIGLRDVSEGAYVTSSTVLAPLYSIDPVKIDFAIPGKYSTQLRTGKPISFTTEGVNQEFHGTVYAIEPRIDPNTRTVTLRARCPNPHGLLLPGQYARIDLVLENKDSVLMVPTQAVIPELQGNKVFVAKGGRASAVNVETGIRTETELEITGGLNPGDTIITTGILQIRHGTEVDVEI